MPESPARCARPTPAPPLKREWEPAEEEGEALGKPAASQVVARDDTLREPSAVFGCCKRLPEGSECDGPGDSRGKAFNTRVPAEKRARSSSGLVETTRRH